MKDSIAKYSYGQILKLALPIIVGQIGNILMGLTDTYFVSKLGVVEIAAAGISNSVFFTTVIIGIGMMVAGSAVVAEAKGNGDNHKVEKLYHSIVWCSVIFGLAINIIVVGLSLVFEVFQ